MNVSLSPRREKKQSDNMRVAPEEVCGEFILEHLIVIVVVVTKPKAVQGIFHILGRGLALGTVLVSSGGGARNPLLGDMGATQVTDYSSTVEGFSNRVHRR